MLTDWSGLDWTGVTPQLWSESVSAEGGPSLPSTASDSTGKEGKPDFLFIY